MGEFHWEKFLKASDARSERYRQVLEKLEPDPATKGWTGCATSMDIPSIPL